MCGRLGPGGLVLPILLQIYDLLFIGQRELGGISLVYLLSAAKLCLRRAFLTEGLRKSVEFLDFISVG